jgi:TRAP-type C4-dicarboxylate transport system substrate-binding protein
VLVAALTAGCAGGSPNAEKSGAPATQDTVTLTLASTPPDMGDVPPVEEFVRKVRVLSDGRLRIHVLSQYGNFAPGSEAQVVRAVAAGKVDLGWAGSRVFDTLGVSSFRALSAPLLIDSYPLEQAVLSSDLPPRMLPALTRLHLAPLALLGDGLRHPVAVHRPLLAAADWHGHSFGGYRSRTQELAVRALGARPVEAFAELRLHDLQTEQIQGFEFDIRRYARNALPTQARYLTANVSLWPEFDVLFANPHQFNSLTSSERSWLLEAARDAARDSVAITSRDAAWVRRACALGAQFVNATPADLASLRAAVMPVYRWLERDPQTRRMIKQIVRLKRSLAAPPSGVSRLPADCRG